ncbi:MAG: hypothetical protein Q9221_001586 [Calogaya cf. arnoldii]
MTEMQNGSQENHPSTTEIPNDLPNTNGHPPSPINSDPDVSKPSHPLTYDPDHAQSNGLAFEEGPPTKRRKVADIATTDTPHAKFKPPSPPWKKFETEGPSTFEENGKRKSARTNRIPLELQPPSTKRQTRAKVQKSTQLPKSKYGGVSQHNSKSGTASSSGNSKKLTTYGKSSAHAPSESPHKNGLHNEVQNPQPHLNPTPVKRAYKKRVSSVNGQSSTNAPSDTSPHQTRRTARTLNSSKRGGKDGGKLTNGHGHTSEVSGRAMDEDGSDQHGDEDDEAADSDSDVVLGDNYKPQRLNLRVKLPSLSVQHPDQVLRARRFPSFRDWFEAEGSKDPEPPTKKPQDNVQVEAFFRRKILEEARPGGLLSREKSGIYAPEEQEEPPRQWAHYDHVIAHHHNFRHLLRKEHENHRKVARALANEAAELWRSRQPKTDEEIRQERDAEYQAKYQQLVRDVKRQWEKVREEAERRRLKELEEEQQMRDKKALNKVLEQSTQLLNQRRRRSSVSTAGSHDDRSSEERDNTSKSDVTSGESHDEANMSTQSESDDGTADNDADDDENLTREELIRKYARVESPNVDKSPVLAKSETHVHDPGGAEAPIQPIIDDNVMTPMSGVQGSQPLTAPADVDEVDDILMDDSEDSTDMDDDMGDSDDDGSSGSGKSGDDSDASEGNTGLLGFINKKELLAAQEQLAQPQGEDEAAPIPDAAQVQTPSASNSEEPATGILETVLAKETSDESPLHHMMNVDSDQSHDHSLPTTPVSAKPLRTPVPSLLRADSAGTGIPGFADLQEFSSWFKKPVEQILEHGRDTMDDEAKAIVTKLHGVLRPYLLRRLKADVEKQMPGKYEHVVYCRLSKRQRYLYDGFMSRAQTRETLASGNYLSIINCLMQLRKVCNHPDLFETRQIVTSFAMPKSAVADFEIKELLVRRRLLHEQPMTRVDLNVINLLPGSNEQPSALDTIQKQRLGALGTLRQLTSQQWPRIDQSMTFDGRSIESTLSYMENAARRARFDELRHAAYLTSLRSQRRPLYSNSLIERLTLGLNKLPMGRRPQRRADLSNWWTESSSALAAMVPTLLERSYAMETTIQKFACVTPAVAAWDLTPLVLSRKGVGPKDVFEDEGYSGDAEADAAMDRVLGGRITGKVFEQAEDQEDIVAARNAEKELVQTDAADFDEKAVPSSGGGATPKTPGPPTPNELMPPPSSISKPVERTTTLEAAQPGRATPNAGSGAGGGEEEEEEEGVNVDEYMLRFVQWETKDIRVQPAVDKSKKKPKKGAEHGIRKR